MNNIITIRKLQINDLSMLLDWRNHADVRKYMLSQHEISPAEHLEWFECVSLDPSRHQLLVLDGGIPFGFVQFSSISSYGCYEWGFYVRPNSPRGRGLQMGYVSLDYAFRVQGFKKVCGQSFSDNAASISFHKKLGFTEETCNHEQVINKDTRAMVCFGLSSSNWFEASNAKKEFG
jgi:UDP-4-amino-4,6-dideoxy-N-acetyl-beta-L-altrosamine N-acetyltransferase